MAEKDDVTEDDNDDAIEFENDGEQESGVFRWMSVAVVLLAISGFFGLAWYAYKSGGDVVDEKDAELIQADNTPVKEPPVNPGGMAIPNQDKSVYNLMKDKKESPKVVEHILAAPETPVTRNADADTGTWMSEQVKGQLKSIEQEKNGSLPAVDATAETKEIADVSPASSVTEQAKEESKHAGDIKELKLADAPEANAKPAETPVVEAKPAEAPKEAAKSEVKIVPIEKPAGKSEEKPKAPEKAVEKPKAPEAKPQESAKPASADEEDATEEPTEKTHKVEEKKPAETKPKEVAASAVPSGVRAQLGAFKSQAEAENQWKRISHKFSGDLSGKNHYIVRADLGAKGVYYRLQLAPFTSAKDAEKFCLALVSDGQGCIPAKGK